MNKITYRELIKEDYNSVKNLIDEAFGFNIFIKDKKALNTLLDLYLQECICESSFCMVAEKDNKVIGIILGNSQNDKNRLGNTHNSFDTDYSELESIMSDKDNKKAIGEFSKIQATYKELIKNQKGTFQGSIQLFVVSKESRGHGVGKTLLRSLSNYMKDMDVKSMYLYTDTRCNYGFYDSHNFKRLNEKEIVINSVQATLNVFLYAYNF